MKKKHGKDLELLMKSKKGVLEERGRNIRRKVLNKTKDEESVEEIKEYIFNHTESRVPE